MIRMNTIIMNLSLLLIFIRASSPIKTCLIHKNHWLIYIKMTIITCKMGSLMTRSTKTKLQIWHQLWSHHSTKTSEMNFQIRVRGSSRRSKRKGGKILDISVKLYQYTAITPIAILVRMTFKIGRSPRKKILTCSNLQSSCC